MICNLIIYVANTNRFRTPTFVTYCINYLCHHSVVIRHYHSEVTKMNSFDTLLRNHGDDFTAYG